MVSYCDPMTCPECERLKNERLAAIKRYVQLTEARNGGADEDHAATADTNSASALVVVKASVNAAWKRLSDHRATHANGADGGSH